MIDSFIRVKSYFVKSLGDELFFTPVNIPVIFLGLFILAIEKGLLNTINKESFEFKLRTFLEKDVQMKGIMILFYILTKVF